MLINRRRIRGPKSLFEQILAGGHWLIGVQWLRQPLFQLYWSHALSADIKQALHPFFASSIVTCLEPIVFMLTLEVHIAVTEELPAEVLSDVPVVLHEP